MMKLYLPWLIVMATCHSLCAGERCPALAFQVGDPANLDITQFGAYISINDTPGLNTSLLGSQVDLIIGGEVLPLHSDLVLPGDLSPLLIHMQLNATASHELYYLFNVWSMNTSIAPPGCPTKEGHLSPGENMVNELYLSCEGDSGQVIMQGCLTLGTAPFDTLNGSYTTLEFYFSRRCEGASSAVCSVIDQSDVVPGVLCLTVNQTQQLVTNPVGSWGLLPAILHEDRAANERGYCVIDRLQEGGVATIIANPTLRPMFPVPESFPELAMIIGLIPDTEALSFSMDFTSTNTTVLGKPVMVPLTEGIIYEDTDVYLQLPCLMPGTVQYIAVMNVSSVLNGILYFQSYNSPIYRDCTPLNTNSTMQDDPRKSEDTVNIGLIAGLIPGLLVLLVTTVTLVVVMVLLTRHIIRKEILITTRLKDMDDLVGNDAYMMKTANSPFEFLREYDMEYNYSSLEVVSELGEGAFGRVFKARAPGLHRGNVTPEFVAVKTLKDGNMLESFCKEIKVVVQFDHPNIIRLLAVCSEISQKCMVFEYMDLGGMDDLLRKSDPENNTTDKRERDGIVLITPSEFLHCCLQIARGVAYLAEQKYIHRDIASRNCLVDHNLVVKIGDFGLSRDVGVVDYYRVGGTQAYLPVRWMPPEALLFGKFTTQSDVWSFGVLMWEVYTFGRQPYRGLSNHEVIDAIKTTKILECPNLCPASVYDIMKICWTRSPIKRPNMDVVLARLERLNLKTGNEDDTSNVEGTTANGCMCYVNMEYGAEVEREELEECRRFEKEANSDSKIEGNGILSNPLGIDMTTVCIREDESNAEDENKGVESAAGEDRGSSRDDDSEQQDKCIQ